MSKRVLAARTPGAELPARLNAIIVDRLMGLAPDADPRGVAGPPARPAAGTARALFIVLALVHLAFVAALFAVFERFPTAGWAALLLYAPRAVFALPALITVVALRGWWRLVPALTAALVLGPLMGLHLNGPSRAGEVRLVAWNVWWGAGDPEAVRAALAEAKPDLVLFEAAAHPVDVVLRAPPFQAFTYLHEDQYVLASRWPARAVAQGTFVSERIHRPWVRFAVDSPIGTLDVIAVHPHSPRALFRGGVRRALGGEKAALFFLQTQLGEIDQAVRGAGPLRIVAGDFNVPERAGLMSGFFAAEADAFAGAGNGYGYTFPANGRWFPWMRLDRILTGPGLRATRARVIGRRGSDHAAVLVELERAGP